MASSCLYRIRSSYTVIITSPIVCIVITKLSLADRICFIVHCTSWKSNRRTVHKTGCETWGGVYVRQKD